jgi:hypothetical protein
MFEARIKTDEKYAAALESFPELGKVTVVLKYGDYCVKGCNTIRSMAAKQDKQVLHGKRWNDVVQELDQKNNALKEWKDNGKLSAEPTTPIKTLLYNISGMWNDFSEEQLAEMMRFYADRNGVAHGGLNEAIKE